MCYKGCLASVFDECRVFESTEVAQDVCDFVSSFFVFDRSYHVLKNLACVLFCLSVFIWCCVFARVVVVVRHGRCSCLCCLGVASLSLRSSAVLVVGRRVGVGLVEDLFLVCWWFLHFLQCLIRALFMRMSSS